jgi:hypothetical protein
MSTVSVLPELLAPSLQAAADAVVRRAQSQGFVRAKEVREELARVGEEPMRWKEVVALARASLSFQHGRYYFASPVSERLRHEKDQQETVAQAARDLIAGYRAARQSERRGEERIDFVQPVLVQTEDGRQFTHLTRDLSTSGMRLIGSRSLLGQKVRVQIAAPQGQTWRFELRILWTCAVGDELFENGGTFLSASAGNKGETTNASPVGIGLSGRQFDPSTPTNR